jgi:hypothetical protein
MSVLAREALFTACRNIYDMAGENYVLPPLIRDARRLESQSSYTYNFLIEEGDLYFNVELDEACADRNAFPLSKLPLRFHIELHDASWPDRLIELDKSEKNELVRAFLLGVKAPIAVEKDGRGQCYKISIQLSSTYFVSCGEFVDKGADYTSQEICHSVAHEMYKSSKEFFGGLEEGLAVWSVRAAQDLFDEPKPSPEIFWPPVRKNAESIVLHHDCPTRERAASQYSRYAVAASIIIGLTGVATSVEFSAGASGPPETAANRIQSNRVALRPERANANVPVRYASNLDNLAILSPAALVVDVEQRFDASEARENTVASSFDGRNASEPPHRSAQPQAPTAAAPVPPSRAAAAAMVSPNVQTSRKPAATAKSDDAGKRQRAVKTAKAQVTSTKLRQSNSPTHDAKAQPLNPLALVGRTVDLFTRRVVKDLKRIHYRFSSLPVR